MSKQEMIDEIKVLCKANEDNPYCSIYWLADQIKEIVAGRSHLGELESVEDD